MRGDGDRRASSDPLRRRLRRLTNGQRREEARAFIRRYFDEVAPRGLTFESRLRHVLNDLGRHGFYRHTPDELAFGARIAWRNHANCIGRLHWKSLEVLDCRHIRHPDDIAAQLGRHYTAAENGGKIRSIISVFSAVEGIRTPAWIESPQMIRYAGYADADGLVVGDPANVELTRIAIHLGWKAPEQRSAFDILPIILRDENGRRHIYEIPPGTVREVDIVHPVNPGLAALNLKWYGVPVVCDMILTIGGMDYPCAPFNGFYMATEIASRNFLDLPRYDLSLKAAEALQIDLSDRLLADRVSTEMNCAVLSSFDRAQMAIVDHHEASDQFIQFYHREKAAGRLPSANWSWITPPEASATCPVFHQPMHNYHDVPNFYRASASDGHMLGVSYAVEDIGRNVRRFYRLRRKFRSWLKTRN